MPKRAYTRKPVEYHLHRHKVVTESGCWLWTGGTDGRYGVIRVNYRLEKVHRISANLYLGYDLSDERRVCHRCDVMLCFNPEHLFVGTQSENLLDSVDKGRWNGVARRTKQRHTGLRKKEK